MITRFGINGATYSREIIDYIWWGLLGLDQGDNRRLRSQENAFRLGPRENSVRWRFFCTLGQGLQMTNIVIHTRPLLDHNVVVRRTS